VGFPIAEMHEDGSFVITKHPGTGGLVSKGTVTAQLLYEVRGPSYLTPDVVVRFDTIHIQEEDADRVMINGVKGEPPTESSKVCINDFSGYRNSMTVVLTGLDIEEKAKIVEDTLFETLEGKEQFAVADVQLIRSEKIDPDVNEEAVAGLRISVMDPDKDKVGRLFSSKVVELALANIPGFTLTSPPTNGMPAIRHWPALVSSHFIKQTVSVAGKEFIVEAVKPDSDFKKTISPEYKTVQIPDGKMINAPLGHAFATRSGDKGGNANLGVWAKTYEGFSYLKDFLTVNRLKELLPDMSEYEIERYELPNLLALNFYIKGVLGEGAAASIRSDPQAKTLGEYLRAKIVEMPEEILVYKD